MSLALLYIETTTSMKAKLNTFVFLFQRRVDGHDVCPRYRTRLLESLCYYIEAYSGCMAAMYSILSER
jgi:hypothetical protein